VEEKSRTRIKKEVTELQKLGERLVALPLHQLEALALPEEIREAVSFAKTIKQHGAYRRQIQYIGVIMRQFDTEPIIRAFAEIDAAGYTRAMEFKQIETTRDELVSDNEELLEDLIRRYPEFDRQRLTGLIRNARKEISLGKPPKSSRNLFRYLTEVMISS
jgi:ribosome-associated protein